MTLCFTEGRYCSQIWYAEVPRQKCNILAALFRDTDHWTFIYRVRHDPGTNDDRKSWYEFHAAPDTPEAWLLGRVEVALREIANAVEDTELTALPVRSSDPKYIVGQIAAQPWASLRQLTEVPK